MAAWGTQTGNPPAPKDGPLSSDVNVSQLFTNAYLSIIDDTSSGDSIYSPEPLRARLSKSCGDSQDSFSLVVSSKSEHSVNIEKSTWSAVSDLVIDRNLDSIIDLSTNTANPCGIDQDFLPLNQIEPGLKISNKFVDFISRDSEFMFGQGTQSQFTEHKKEGSVDVMFIGSEAESDTRVIKAEGFYNQDLLVSAESDDIAFNFKGVATKITAAIQYDKSSQMPLSYYVQNGSWVGSTDDEITVTMDVSDTAFSVGDCLAKSGLISGQISAEGVELTYEIDFSQDNPRIILSDGRDLMFTPVACVLNEQ